MQIWVDHPSKDVLQMSITYSLSWVLKKYSKNFLAVAKLHHNWVLTSLHSDLLSYRQQSLPLEGKFFGFLQFYLQCKDFITPILLPAGDSMSLQELIPQLAPPWLGSRAQGWRGHILPPLGLAQQLPINKMQEFH